MACLKLVERLPESAWDVELWMTAEGRCAAPAVAVAVAMAIDLDFDLETVDDIRMATDELCSELATRAVPSARMHCGFEIEPSCLGVTVEVEVAQRPRPADRLATEVVRVLANSVSQEWVATDKQPGGILSTTFRVAPKTIGG